MKTIAAALIVLSTGLGLNTIALAEPFNEGGVHHVYTVQSDPNAPRPIVDTTPSQPFTDRGTDYIVEALPGKPSQNHDFSLPEQGWNS
ncbi:MAG: hypothetical protein V2J55_21835 [Candidatus Competibacteraceae bacterium]|jgi:hypothetical protein|nr:hypothetical protein [Candidatus Competibacteraceae bacterium]